MDAGANTYGITLTCSGIPAEEGAQAANDITEEFAHRPWHQNVRCEWDGSLLILYAENDYDPDGKALIDEFSDAIYANITEPGGGGIEIRSIVTVPQIGSGLAK